MKSKYNFKNPIRNGSLGCLLVAAFLLLGSVRPVLAENKYLPANKPDGVALLSPPPAVGTPEYEADLSSARAVCKGRTPEAEARAHKSATLSLFNFASVIGPFFTPEIFHKTEQFYLDLKPEIRPAIVYPKDNWKRKRPYEVDPSLWVGKPETSFSYPSGHSAVGTIQALLLAELFPEKRDAILAMGRDIGWDRVVIGKHFPTDVHAGRVLGQAIFRELMANENFQNELAEVKNEVKAQTRDEATKKSGKD